MKTKLLFDADMLLYVALQRAEREIEWQPNLFTLHCDLNEATTHFEEHTQELIKLVLDHWNIEGEYSINMAMTDLESNFRKTIDEQYKANRKSKRRPVAFLQMRQWIRDEFNTLEIPTLEADDCIGINADKNAIIISGDKDFRSIPCRFYDFMRNEFYETTKQEAHYFHMYQTLIGDVVDNYKGCQGVGAVKAERMLDEDPSWERVVKAYEASGQTEEEALKNARLAFILHKGYYNKKTKEVKLWTP